MAQAKLIILLIIGFYPFCAHSQEFAESPSPELVLKAIHFFHVDPVREDADAALSIVANFAEHSSAVLVELDPKYLPWELGTLDTATETKFIGAFIAGNVEYQLRNGITENRPFEGLRFVLYTYSKLREADVIEVLSEFEELIKLEKEGQLGGAFAPNQAINRTRLPSLASTSAPQSRRLSRR